MFKNKGNHEMGIFERWGGSVKACEGRGEIEDENVEERRKKR